MRVSKAILSGVLALLTAYFFFPAAASALDCNFNGEDDAVETAAGDGTDCNANAVLDSCDLQANVAFTTLPYPKTPLRNPEYGDLNANGLLDRVAVLNDAKTVAIFFGQGDGLFSEGIALATSFGGIRSLRLADIDDDGDLDIVYSPFNESLSILVNDATGGFSEPTQLAAPSNVRDILTGDFDGDGDTDLLLISVEEGFDFYYNDGEGGLRRQTMFIENFEPLRARSADFNSDDKLDLVVEGGTAVAVLLFQSVDNYNLVTLQSRSLVRREIEIADFDGMSGPDVLVADSNSSAVYFNDGNAAFTKQDLSLVVSGIQEEVVVADINGDLEPDVVTRYQRQGYQLLLNDGSGGLFATRVLGVEGA
jgi:hypothetical protein